MIITVITSIFLISSGIWVIRKIRPSFKVCPICVGVSGTWLWMLIANYFGYAMDVIIISMLMGGSVVGIAYQLEKKIKPEKGMAWKVLFIPTGFAIAYKVIYFSWFHLIILLAVISLLLFIFLDWSMFRRDSGRNSKVSYIEKEMENCC